MAVCGVFKMLIINIYSHKIIPNSTGKELDPLRLYLQSGELCRARLTSPPDLLTGYSYFAHQVRGAYHGSRYLDHELMTMWFSVDPMADKYPSISPYAYYAWNPVKIIDPNGDTIVVIIIRYNRQKYITMFNIMTIYKMMQVGVLLMILSLISFLSISVEGKRILQILKFWHMN